MARSVSKHGWSMRHLWWAIGMVALGVAATFSAWVDIFRIASVDEESSHIFLVFPIAAWLIWMRRGRLRRCEPKGMVIGPALVLLGWAMSSVGFWRSIQTFFHAGAVLLVVGCLLTVLGRDVLLRFLPAFAVLLFLVPVPGRVRQQIALPMQTATAQVTQTIFDVLGEPVERSGNVLSINGKQVAIAEACNGQRMVFTLLLVCYAFAFGEPLRNHVRALILLASPVCAIVCNVVRMIPTIWMYGYQSESVAAPFHDYAGWVMLGVAFWLLKSIIDVLRWALVPGGHYTLAAE